MSADRKHLVEGNVICKSKGCNIRLKTLIFYPKFPGCYEQILINNNCKLQVAWCKSMRSVSAIDQKLKIVKTIMT